MCPISPTGRPDRSPGLLAGFLGQEQANVRLAAGTTLGIKRLRVKGL